MHRINTFFQYADSYYASVDTDIEDISDASYLIRANNSGTDINVKFSDPPISLKTSDLKNCCKYKYYVLNQNCKNAVSFFTNFSELSEALVIPGTQASTSVDYSSSPIRKSFGCVNEVTNRPFRFVVTILNSTVF